MCAFTHRRSCCLFNHNKPTSFGRKKDLVLRAIVQQTNTQPYLYLNFLVLCFSFVRHVFSDFKDRIASKLISFFVVRQEIEGGQRIKEEEEQAQYLSITKSTQHGIKTAVRAKPFFIPGREKKKNWKTQQNEPKELSSHDHIKLLRFFFKSLSNVSFLNWQRENWTLLGMENWE